MLTALVGRAVGVWQGEGLGGRGKREKGEEGIGRRIRRRREL